MNDEITQGDVQMKKYVKSLPFILFPYLFLLYSVIIQEETPDLLKSILFYFIIGISILSMIAYNVSAIRGTYEPRQAAWVNLWVRIALIPIYVCIFVFGCMGLLLGPFAIGAIALAFIIDVIMIVLTSVMTIGCNIALARGNVFPKGLCVLFWFLNCVFVLDVILAIVYVVVAQAKHKQCCPIYERLV